MRRTATVIGALALGGCIPQVDIPGASAAPPPRPVQRGREAPPEPVYPVPTQDDRPSSNAEVTSLPAPRPAWEARAVTPDATEIPASTVIAQPGDTLNRVAERTGAGVEAIARANDLAPPFALDAGQRLAIPGTAAAAPASGSWISSGACAGASRSTCPPTAAASTASRCSARKKGCAFCPTTGCRSRNTTPTPAPGTTT